MKVWKNRTHVLKCISVFLQSSAWRTNICILPADSVMLWRWISDFDCMSFVELISFFYKKCKNYSMEKLCPYRPFWFWCLQSKSVKEKIITRIIVSRCEVDLMKVRAEFKRNFGKSLHQTILVSFHLSLFLHIFSVIYISLLFLLLVCLHSRSMLTGMFLFMFFSSGAHQGWLPESSTEPLWRRWLNICNLLLRMSSSKDFLKRLVKNEVLL